MKNTMDGLKGSMETGVARAKVQKILIDHLVSLGKNFHPEAGVEITIMLSHQDYKTNTPMIGTMSPCRTDVPLSDILGAVQALVDSRSIRETMTLLPDGSKL